jgi:hypothetical protein
MDPFARQSGNPTIKHSDYIPLGLLLWEKTIIFVIIPALLRGWKWSRFSNVSLLQGAAQSVAAQKNLRLSPFRKACKQ